MDELLHRLRRAAGLVLQADRGRARSKQLAELALRDGHDARDLHRVLASPSRSACWPRAARFGKSTIQGVVGRLRQYRLYGARAHDRGARARARSCPTALIFVFDTILLFTLVPFLMALGGKGKMKSGRDCLVRRQERRHASVQHRHGGRGGGGVLRISSRRSPIDTMLTFLKNAAAPCALFTMGVTVALRPLKRIPVEMPGAAGHQAAASIRCWSGCCCPGSGISSRSGCSPPC